jgi:hypothetical protein
MWLGGGAERRGFSNNTNRFDAAYSLKECGSIPGKDKNGKDKHIFGEARMFLTIDKESYLLNPQ